MEKISIKGNNKIPNVNFDPEIGLIEFKGKSIIENPTVFYDPLEVWLNQYLVNPKETTVANFSFDYYNTSSAAYILRILKKLEKLHQQNKKVVINWICSDPEMMDTVNDYKVLIKVPFNVINIAN